MIRLRCTLLADGPSDRALVPLLRWLLREHCGLLPVDLEVADLGRLARPPRKLSQRIDMSIELYPCDLLFVHRDAEKEPIDRRMEEIQQSLVESARGTTVSAISVVPARMLEAWLLIDEAALRTAAGNPRGRQPLDMPTVKELENLVNSKKRLHDILRDASGLRSRRRLAQFNRDLGKCVQRAAEQIESFAVLRELAAFRALERQIVRFAEGAG